MSPLHAKIVAYKGHLVFELLATKSIDGEVTTSLDVGHYGQIIHNTKKHLGISPEAILLLKQLKKGPRPTGDLKWFNTREGNRSFGWAGANRYILEACIADTDQEWKVTDDYVTIENNVPKDAIFAIDDEGIQ